MSHDDNELLSVEALKWLKSVDYQSKSHEERMTLISAAKIAYPNSGDEADPEFNFFAALGLA